MDRCPPETIESTESADGQLFHAAHCSETGCEHGRARNEEYDAYYCPRCGMWLEPRCGDPECEMCGDRPLKSPNEQKRVRAKGLKRTKKKARSTRKANT
jgi:methionyl-tRNA synthetase